MDYRNAFAISASGMTVEKTRLDVTALNLANVHASRGPDGRVFQPLTVRVAEAHGSFAARFDGMFQAQMRGARVVAVEATQLPPRLAYDPGHPDANAKGYVELPAVNQVTEMVNLSSALRAYEANVAAMNAAKTMSLKALELGSNG